MHSSLPAISTWLHVCVLPILVCSARWGPVLPTGLYTRLAEGRYYLRDYIFGSLRAGITYGTIYSARRGPVLPTGIYTRLAEGRYYLRDYILGSLRAGITYGTIYSARWGPVLPTGLFPKENVHMEGRWTRIYGAYLYMQSFGSEAKRIQLSRNKISGF